ncbi:hypothetical protein N7454_004330 [Penicillium verhagenii]|nr:hypothetical protein N7454_004330 [Penicillium verhagenii]
MDENTDEMAQKALNTMATASSTTCEAITTLPLLTASCQSRISLGLNPYEPGARKGIRSSPGPSALDADGKTIDRQKLLHKPDLPLLHKEQLHQALALGPHLRQGLAVAVRVDKGQQKKKKPAALRRGPETPHSTAFVVAWNIELVFSGDTLDAGNFAGIAKA